MNGRLRSTLAAFLVALFCLLPLAEIDAKELGKNLDKTQIAAIKGILGEESVKNAKVSIQVVNLITGKTLYSHNPQNLVIPASTNKVVSGAAAIDILGPDYRFKTKVYYDGSLSPDGTLTGNLYIKGGGDPSMNLEQAWLLAHRIRSHGVLKVTGKLIGDESFLDSVRHYAEWGKVGTRAYHAPLGALSVNYNTIGVYVAPGAVKGATANAILDPETSLYTLENHLTTSAGGRERIAMSLRDKHAVVSGQIPLGAKGRAYYRSIDDPLPFALSVFERFLNTEGVTVAQGYAGGTVPDNAQLLLVSKSKPLSLIIRDLYRNSNNFTAEQTARTLGAETLGVPGTQQKAAQAITNWLTKKKLIQPGVNISDASGLSRENKQSAGTLVNVLSYMWNKPEVAPEYIDAMAIGGKDGTLSHRFRKTSLTGRVRAKSGLLWGVITLAGYAYDSDGTPYAFAVMVNDYAKNASARDVQLVAERLLDVMMK